MAISLRLKSLAVVSVVAFALVAVSGGVDPADSQAPRLAKATLTVLPGAPLQAVPRSFLGISTEYWALPLYARRMALFERVLEMLHVPGSGPFVVRVGGDSADHAFWAPRAARLPPWAFTLNSTWLGQVRELVHRLGVHLIVDLNLITDTPAEAAAWASAAEHGLPRHSIVGFEIGNEPDIYSHRGWIATTAGRMIADAQLSARAGGRLPADLGGALTSDLGGRLSLGLGGRLSSRAGCRFSSRAGAGLSSGAGGQLPSGLTPADYVTDFRAYTAALHGVAPGVPLLGPALANPHANVRWIARLLADKPAALKTVSVHRYPYSACAKRRGQADFPTLSRLLSRQASAGLTRSLEPAIALAHRAGLPIRLTELNSITCGGRAGLSNAFATALWAPAALLHLARAGIDGVNVHIRANTINAPFALSAGGLTARPLLYGLILFARTLGPSAALAPVALRAPSSPHLSAWAVRVRGSELHVLLINEGRRAVKVTLRLPTTGSAWVQRLLAPSAASASHVTLAGQQLGRDAAWQRQRVEPQIAAATGGYRVTVPRFSAALLGARLRPGALTGAPGRAP